MKTIPEWCDTSPCDIIVVNPNNEWSSHNALFRSFCFCLVCVGQDQISIAHHARGRLLQVRLNLPRSHDFVLVDQQAWSLQHGVRHSFKIKTHLEFPAALFWTPASETSGHGRIEIEGPKRRRMLPLWCKFALEIIIVGGNSFLTSGLRGFRPSVVFVTRRSPLFRTRHKGLRTNRQTFFIFLPCRNSFKGFPIHCRWPVCHWRP